MREENGVGLMTLNGSKFVGSITPQEAKFSIYTDSLANLLENFPDVWTLT